MQVGLESIELEDIIYALEKLEGDTINSNFRKRIGIIQEKLKTRMLSGEPEKESIETGGFQQYLFRYRTHEGEEIEKVTPRPIVGMFFNAAELAEIHLDLGYAFHSMNLYPHNAGRGDLITSIRDRIENARAALVRKINPES